MPQDELSGPDLDGVVADANAVGLPSLRSIVGFKRLAGRGQDRLDLENLERVNGELPIDPIPGLDAV
jgi:hypothetical protein